MNKSLEDKVLGSIVMLVLLLTTVLTLYPLYYSIINSFNSGLDINRHGYVFLFPRVFTMSNYKIVFQEKTLLNSLFITAARTIVGTAISVFFTAIVAYPLSKKHFIFRKIYLKIGVITMYFWGGLIPFYILLKTLHLIDKFAVFIIPMMFSFFNAVIFINFFSEIPESMEESAKIDGANDIYIFLRIVIPLSTPVLATIALFSGVEQWNAWFDSVFFTSSSYLQTLQSILWKIVSQAQAVTLMKRYAGAATENTASVETVKYATMVVSILPISFAYPFLQRFFIKGIMLGSLKG